MAFSSLKPCSRIMRGSPHQTDQQKKEGYYLLQDHEDQAEEAQREVHAPTFIKNLCELKLPPSTGSDPSSFQEEVPTFIAHQGQAPSQFGQKVECKLDMGYAASGWFKKEQQLSKDQPLCPFSPQDSHLQSTYSHIALPPPPEVSRRTHKLSFMRAEPRKHSAEQDNHNKQRTSYRKTIFATDNIYDLTLEQAIPVRVQELGLEKRRNSSASVQDMVSFREAVSSKERCHDGRSSSSWEEEVRQAMARSLIGKKQVEDAHGLQRSTSVKEYGTSVYPPTLLVRTTGGSGKVDATAACSEAGSKLDKQPFQKAAVVEKGLWRGFNVKSPSEERWEEAAEVEERQELQRRARSQSMRYETSSRSAELEIGGPWDARSSGNAAYNDDEWAVYKKSGYVNIRPRSSDTFAAPVCCSSLLGRSLSMRDTRMGLVMECAACGAALHGAGGRLLCFCSCCAGARASSSQGGTAAPVKKKGGILRACRRFLGLGKKRSSDTHT